MEISFTQLRVYLECPWKYKLFFIDRQRIAPTPASSLGTVIHRTLERYHRAGAPGLEDLLGFYDREWLRSSFSSAETERQWRLKGERILRRYSEYDAARRTEIIGMEREFVYPLGEHHVRGMIDRIDRHPDGRCEILDYKTQMEPGTEDQVRDDLQLRFYALGARESLALEPSTLTIHYLASGKTVSAAYDSSGEKALKGLILETADKIAAGAFKADTNFCPRCGFKDACRFSAVRP